jgi:sulfur-carrier protein
MKIRMRYFASLRDAAGTEVEELELTHADAVQLYAETAQRHALKLPRERLRLAVNGELVSWQQPLQPGDEVVFLPPVSGG